MGKGLREILKGKWAIPFALASGVGVGLIFTILYLSNAVSYLSDEPETCYNCHIMRPAYATWAHSSHREFTNCNDCHVPHNNVAAKYYFKAKDGARHAAIFTLGLEPQVIKINQAGTEVVQENCKRCHIRQVETVSVANVTGRNFKRGEGHLCWSCHRHTPHGRTHSLSVTYHFLKPEIK